MNKNIHNTFSWWQRTGKKGNTHHLRNGLTKHANNNVIEYYCTIENGDVFRETWEDLWANAEWSEQIKLYNNIKNFKRPKNSDEYSDQPVSMDSMKHNTHLLEKTGNGFRLHIHTFLDMINPKICFTRLYIFITRVFFSNGGGIEDNYHYQVSRLQMFSFLNDNVRHLHEHSHKNLDSN